MTTPPIESIHARLDRIRDLAEKMGRQTHAGFAMIVAAALDRLLEEALMTKMVQLDQNMREKLFGDFGTLRSFSAKINTAYAVGVLDQNTMLRLTALRKIRNLFAHTNERCDFDTPGVRKLIAATPDFMPMSKSSEDFVALAERIELRLTERAGLAHVGIIKQLDADW